MGGDEKLRASPNMLIDQHQGRHTSLNRQGGFGFIEQIEPRRAESVLQQVDEGFTV
ncbi:MAG: hypothetical protein QOF99_1060 [Pseudonocardiales bacterium]|jgi:hypothetical protein|nr:hypothetical protein [Pseudonocardiales bacterium]